MTEARLLVDEAGHLSGDADVVGLLERPDPVHEALARSAQRGRGGHHVDPPDAGARGARRFHRAHARKPPDSRRERGGGAAVGRRGGDRYRVGDVQRVIARHRNPRQMIPPEESTFSFHASFFIAARRIAELGRIAPVRPERHEARRLFALRATQDFLHCRLQVVVPQQVEDAPEIMERQLVRLQERLLRGVPVGPVEGRPARHPPHREHLQLLPTPVQVRVRLVIAGRAMLPGRTGCGSPRRSPPAPARS